MEPGDQLDMDDEGLADFLDQQKELEAKMTAEKKDAVDEGELKPQFDDEIEVVNSQPKKRERRAPRRKDNNLAIEKL